MRTWGGRDGGCRAETSPCCWSRAEAPTRALRDSRWSGRLRNGSRDAGAGWRRAGLWPLLVQSRGERPPCQGTAGRVSLPQPARAGEAGGEQLRAAPGCHQSEPGGCRTPRRHLRMLLREATPRPPEQGQGRTGKDLLDDAVAPEAGDELRGRGDGEVPLQVHLPVLAAPLRQVQPGHAGSAAGRDGRQRAKPRQARRCPRGLPRGSALRGARQPAAAQPRLCPNAAPSEGSDKPLRPLTHAGTPGFTVVAASCSPGASNASEENPVG